MGLLDFNENTSSWQLAKLSPAAKAFGDGTQLANVINKIVDFGI